VYFWGFLRVVGGGSGEVTEKTALAIGRGDGFSISTGSWLDVRNKLGTTKVQPGAESADSADGAGAKKCGFPKKIEKAL